MHFLEQQTIHLCLKIKFVHTWSCFVLNHAGSLVLVSELWMIAMFDQVLVWKTNFDRDDHSGVLLSHKARVHGEPEPLTVEHIPPQSQQLPPATAKTRVGSHYLFMFWNCMYLLDFSVLKYKIYTLCVFLCHDRLMHAKNCTVTLITCRPELWMLDQLYSPSPGSLVNYFLLHICLFKAGYNWYC